MADHGAAEDERNLLARLERHEEVVRVRERERERRRMQPLMPTADEIRLDDTGFASDCHV